MRRIKFLAVFVLLVLVFSVGPGVVMAKDPPPDWTDPAIVYALAEQLATADDAAAMWERLSPEAQAAVLEYTTVKHVATSVTTGKNSVLPLSTCKWAQVEMSMHNVFGHKLWSYFQKIEWCYNGSTITSPLVRLRWGEVYAPLWQYMGHIGNTTSGGVGSSSYRAWTQGHFKWELVGYPMQHKYPWIDMTVYGNGNWTWSGGG